MKNNLCDVSNEDLDPDFVIFTASARVKRYHSIARKFISYDIADERHVHPVTPEERVYCNDISSKNIEEIQVNIEEMIESISCSDTKEYYQSVDMDLLDRKPEVIDFYRELRRFVENQEV